MTVCVRELRFCKEEFVEYNACKKKKKKDGDISVMLTSDDHKNDRRMQQKLAGLIRERSKIG